LGSAHARPTKVVDNTQSTDAFRKGVSTERRESAVIDRARASNVVGGDSEMDYLDIPAFLRRQAD
jgi:cell division protein FtsZ